MAVKNRYNNDVKTLGSRIILLYLRVFAKFALAIHTPPVIVGIAGSVGKSSTRKALEAIFKEEGTVKSIGNSETGIPLGLLGIKPIGFSTIHWLLMLLRVPFGVFHLRGTDVLIVEMGIDDPYPPKNMTYLLSIIQPTIGIIVNESAAHTMQFEKLLTNEQKKHFSDSDKIDYLVGRIAEEDMKMVKADECKVVIYNADNIFIKKQIELIIKDEKKSFISYGKSKDNNIIFTDYEVDLNGTKMTFQIDKNTANFSTHLILPQGYLEVIAAALGVVQSIFAKKNEVTSFTDRLKSLSQHFTLPKGRGNLFEGIHESMIIDSTYNASKASVLTYLMLLEVLKKKTGRKTVFAFGDMRELGEEAAGEHKIVAEVIRSICDEVYCVGELTKKYVLPLVEKDKKVKATWFSSNIQLGKYLEENLPSDSIILLKGSQNTIFLEESVKYILKNKEDYRLLCRQDPFWLDIKQRQDRLFTQ